MRENLFLYSNSRYPIPKWFEVRIQHWVLTLFFIFGLHVDSYTLIGAGLNKFPMPIMEYCDILGHVKVYDEFVANCKVQCIDDFDETQYQFTKIDGSFAFYDLIKSERYIIKLDHCAIPTQNYIDLIDLKLLHNFISSNSLMGDNAISLLGDLNEDKKLTSEDEKLLVDKMIRGSVILASDILIRNAQNPGFFSGDQGFAFIPTELGTNYELNIDVLLKGDMSACTIKSSRNFFPRIISADWELDNLEFNKGETIEQYITARNRISIQGIQLSLGVDESKVKLDELAVILNGEWYQLKKSDFQIVDGRLYIVKLFDKVVSLNKGEPILGLKWKAKAKGTTESAILADANSFNQILSNLDITQNFILHYKSIRKNQIELSNITNLPNPFVYETSINFEVNKSCIIHFILVDLTGKIILDFDKLVKEGPNDIVIQNEQLCSTGTYLWTIEAGLEHYTGSPVYLK